MASLRNLTISRDIVRVLKVERWLRDSGFQVLRSTPDLRDVGLWGRSSFGFEGLELGESGVIRSGSWGRLDTLSIWGTSRQRLGPKAAV